MHPQIIIDIPSTILTLLTLSQGEKRMPLLSFTKLLYTYYSILSRIIFIYLNHRFRHPRQERFRFSL